MGELASHYTNASGCEVPDDGGIKFVEPIKIAIFIVGGSLLGVSFYNIYNYLIKQGKYKDWTNLLLYFAIVSILITLMIGVSQVDATMDTCNLILIFSLWWV